MLAVLSKMQSKVVNKCKCFSCGGLFSDMDGPVHQYMHSTPGCWSVYGEVLTRGYSDLSCFNVNRLVADAYAVQHPGSTDRQSIQSVGMHLIRLCLCLEHGLKAEDANDAMLEAAKGKQSFAYLNPPVSFGSITAADVANAESAEEHIAIVQRWAQSSWDAWSVHHATIRTWLHSSICR